jgi:hypothetical protein
MANAESVALVGSLRRADAMERRGPGVGLAMTARF